MPAKNPEERKHWETVNREKKAIAIARKLQEVNLRRMLATLADRVEGFDDGYRLASSLEAGQKPASEETWSRVVWLLRHPYEMEEPELPELRLGRHPFEGRSFEDGRVFCGCGRPASDPIHGEGARK